MGIKVPMYTGAETLAKKLDMAVVFLNAKRIKRGYYEARFKTIAENPRDYKDYEITDMFFKLVEQQIQDDPQYYLWTHKRWKHRDKVPAKFL
jgi:KDO2-lipid IV(A) lauroyltransferase